MAANTHSTTHNGNTLRTRLNPIKLPICKTERLTMGNFIGFNPTNQFVSSSQPNILTCKPLTTIYEVGTRAENCGPERLRNLPEVTPLVSGQNKDLSEPKLNIPIPKNISSQESGRSCPLFHPSPAPTARSKPLNARSINE